VEFELTDRSGCGKTLRAYGQRIYRESLGASKANWHGIAVATALRLTFRELQVVTQPLEACHSRAAQRADCDSASHSLLSMNGSNSGS